MNRFPWRNYSDDRLLKVRLKDLGVTIEGTWLEGCVAQLYEELDARALVLKPHVWLSVNFAGSDVANPGIPAEAGI